MESSEIMNTTTTLVSSTATTIPHTTPPSDLPPLYAGFIACGVSCIFFGSNFAPIKKFETGDGMFFQWVMTTAVWHVGLIVHAVRGFPTFYPLAMLGGFIWSTGNVCVVPIVKTIGLSVGLLIWGIFNLLSGWASGTFGWFGLEPTHLKKEALNYAGVSLAAVSAVFFLFIKPTVSTQAEQIPNVSHQPRPPSSNEEAERLLTLYGTNSRDSSVNTAGTAGDAPGEIFLDRMGPTGKRVLGIVLSVISGILYGLCFTPVIYIQEHQRSEGASQNGLDYVFAHFCGIYASSFFYFLVYCIFMKNKPRVYPRAILPGIISGAMWGIAQTSWFIANEVLSEAVSFPIITTGPALVAALWGVFVFKEIQGRRNLVILVGAFCVTVGGVLLTAFSKV